MKKMPVLSDSPTLFAKTAKDDSNQVVHPRSLVRVSVVRTKKLCILGHPKCVQWRLLSDCPNAQAYLNPGHAHMSAGTVLTLRCWWLEARRQDVSAGLGGSVGCAVRLETRTSRVQPPPRSATFFRGDWSSNIFYGHSLPSADSRRAVVSFWRKNVHNTG